MNMSALAQALQAAGVSSRYYRFGPYGHGGSDDSYVLAPEGSKFNVSYVERGRPSLVGSFETEGDACEFLLKELTREDCFQRRST